MEITFTIAGKTYTTHAVPHDISIPVRFDDKQLRAFGAPGARREAHKAGEFTGNVGQGGSCNCDVLHFAPHLHGTHTECVGHITRVPIAVCDVWRGGLIPAMLVTIVPETSEESAETYDPALLPGDQLITAAALKKTLQTADSDFLEALVIRTLPNAETKRSVNYDSARPPFFSIEAMKLINGLGVAHLLVDMPSIDRLADEGKLTNHHIFWGLAAGSHEADAKNPSPKTVTELVYVPDEVADGPYVLNLQVAPLAVDAAPSRPILYGVK